MNLIKVILLDLGVYGLAAFAVGLSLIALAIYSAWLMW
jgi:hypothetical protein